MQKIIIFYLCIFSLIMWFSCSLLAQNDTTIGENHFEIIKRYINGKAKTVGQFGTDCVGNKHRKHGLFIKFNDKGEISWERYYFYNKRRNRKIFGLKHGWWGFYLHNQKYFLGKRVGSIHVVDPCF